MISKLVFLVFVNLVLSQNCYWNDGCSYQLYSSKTPYDTARGDIRDYPIPKNCQAVSLWSLNRHGNRNPGTSVTNDIRVIANLKQEIIDSHKAGRGQLCAQDIENFKKWTWNETLDVSQSYLTGTGYEELYGIARRLAEKYPHLLDGSEKDFYFRTTDEQRTITSSMAFVHGLTEGANMSLSVDGPWARDDVIRPYENCDKYQQEVKSGALLNSHMDAYHNSQEFITVQNNVQNRLGINTKLSHDDIYSLYEICRFHRTWERNLKSPWCAAFSDEDLTVLEYKEDVRHYYRNAYGSPVNPKLGAVAVKDLFTSLNSFVQNENQRKIVAYFTHDTMIEMTASALELFKDADGIHGGKREPKRLWRTSEIGCFSANILAVLNSCEESGNQTYKVQFFLNEKVTDLCPFEGCTWQEFRNKYQAFTTADLSFCAIDSREPPTEAQQNRGSLASTGIWILLINALLLLR